MPELHLPRLRSHIRVTYPGGWSFWCPEGHQSGWAKDEPVGRTCKSCGAELSAKRCPDIVTEGIVRDIVTGATGLTLVYLGGYGRKRGDREVFIWPDVIAAVPIETPRPAAPSRRGTGVPTPESPGPQRRIP